VRRAARGAQLREIGAIVRRRGWIALLIALLIPAGVYVYTARQPKTYQANLVVEVANVFDSTGPRELPV